MSAQGSLVFPPVIPVELWCEDRYALVCPVCGYDYIHPVKVTCNPAGAAGGAISIDSKGFHWSKGPKPLGRGVHLELTFGCECDHRFTYSLQFYKGQTFVEKASEECGADWNTIWRD